MSLTSFNKEKNNKTDIVKASMNDYSGESYFIKKNEKAKEVIKKYGLPKPLKENK